VAPPELWFNHGNTLREAGRSDEAIAAYRNALAGEPDFAGAHFRLAELLHAGGATAEALPHWGATLARHSGHAGARRRLVAAADTAGDNAEATRLLEEALQQAPADTALLAELAERQRLAGDLPAAVALQRRLVAAAPRDASARDRLGVLLATAGDLAAALAELELALVLVTPPGGGEPGPAAEDRSRILSNLATVHGRRNRLDLAIPLFRQALALEPNSEETAAGLVKSLARGGACDEAVAVAAAATERQPDNADLHQAHGYALTLHGRIGEALAAFATARRADPAHVLAHLNACFTSLYSDEFSAEEVTARHRELAGAVAARQPPGPPATPRDPDPERRLRVGYLGPDFKGHPVGYFLESALAHHDPEVVEVVCYADVANPDPVTDRLRNRAARWHDVYGWDVERLAAQIRGDGIDVLVELGGHTAAHAATLLPRRPAPVQVLYLGYPCTSGVPAVDYVISDALVSPPEADPLYSETVARLDGCFLCFRPYPEAPAVAPPPAEARGFVTFGCYNNLPKLSPRATALWARVLQRVAGSRLVLKAPGLDDPPTRERLLARFDALGIARERVALLGITSPLAAFLAEYGRIDIALDSLPYTGGTTTCEALWMGVPVVTLAGRHFHERMGASILTAVGLPDLVAASEGEYVAIAAGLAKNVPALGRMRAGMRERLLASRLCDGPGFARALEAAYRRMWRQRLERGPESRA
jgi:protein O-GlcNAc transferase